jgi:HPt (histidine-containing phosphotransfer) domain-containing protein
MPFAPSEPFVPLVDVRELSVWATLQPEQLQQMVQLFGEESEQLMTDLQKAVHDGSQEMVLRHLHQLKGVCLALFLAGLKQWITRLERQVKAEGVQVLPPEVPHLQAALQRAHRELNQLLETLPKSVAH